MRLGIDIGGTKTAAVVLDDAGEVVAHESGPSGRGADGTLARAAEVARRAAGVVGGWSRIEALGACMPGLVDREAGVARHAVNLGVESVDLRAGLAAATGLTPCVDNDVKAAALGAHHLLRGQLPPGRTAYLNIGTGLAAALVGDGRVLHGIDGAVGEIGHLPVGTGIPCPCGQVGCLETIGSGGAVERAWHHPVPGLFPAAAAGDPDAVAVVASLAHGVALAVQALVLTGAEVVVVGGGVARDTAPFEAAVRADIAAREAESSFLRRLALPARIRVLDGDLPLAARGAALLGDRVAAH